MANTYVSALFHLVFSTRNREPWLVEPVRGQVLPYLGGIAEHKGMTMLCAGGYVDHVHLLLSLPAETPVSRAAQLIKGGSSYWVRRTFAELRSFAWQEGYGAFSVGASQIEPTRRYVAAQAEHHRVRSFQDEYRAFLARHSLPCDERYAWG